MIPNKKNFCGGAFPDWLEVNLIKECNGRCSWCIERDGYHPDKVAEWWEIAEQALKHGAQNIILLGGEPTLYHDIKPLIKVLSAAGRDVWITTNGSRLSVDYVRNKIAGIKGINISVHHYSLPRNYEITGLLLHEGTLKAVIEELHLAGANVRMNCNCIAGEIDSVSEIEQYVEFAKRIGADKIRFAELKQDGGGFVDLAKILNYKYGLNDNPFIHGCNNDAIINGMPVNFRQMCGLQTSRRVEPENPQQVLKKVLYYDGKIYDGWKKQEEMMLDHELVKLLEEVAVGKKSPIEAAAIITKEKSGKSMKEIVESVKKEVVIGGGCHY